ncbi:putative Late embryogenesis abundant protein, LEA_2 subgroup [Helianthus debilis subsp. tardiflorus]
MHPCHFAPPHEPLEPLSLYSTPDPHHRTATPSPLAHAVTPVNASRHTMMIQTQTPTQTQTPMQAQTPEYFYERFPDTRDRLRLRNHRNTDPAIWCCAIICLVFSILIILFGITTLIIFLVVKPKNPVFDTNHASLNVVYFDSPGNYNGDFTFIANFTNPNRKLNVRFEYAAVELCFANSVIANQSIRPFSQRQRETGVVKLHFVSSLVPLPSNHAMELKRQVLSNKVMYSVKGTFKVRVSFGLIHFSYWLHSRCELQMSSPPSGLLMARRCITKR